MVPKTERDAKGLLAAEEKQNHKKRKQRLIDSVIKETASLDGVAAQEEVVADKKLIRKQKRMQKSKGEDARPGMEQAVALDSDEGTRKEAQSEPGAMSRKSDKKKKKKGRKSFSDLNGDAAVVGAAEVDTDISEQIKPKKMKKIDGNVTSPSGEQDANNSVDGNTWRQQHSVTVEGIDVQPVLSFANAGFTERVLHATREFVQPSPIQAQCWPIILRGRDLIGIAATGSGKTLAFGLPALQRIVKGEGSQGGKCKPTVLILAPTRELALQTAGVMDGAGSSCDVQCVCVYGGVPKKQQVSALRQGARVVAGTPGRIQDLMEEGSLNLAAVDYVVLDEADRMLDLGFEPSVRAIVSATMKERQTLMFSATWPLAVQRLAGEFLRTPVKVVIGSQDLSASHSVKQVVEVIDQRDKEARLLQLLNKYHANGKDRVLVFVLYKKEATRMEQFLSRKGWKIGAVHGDLSQQQRSAAVDAFKSGAVPLLLATDVAARGLDIPDVEAVINFSFPLTTEDYVHRIGRTGRAGRTGTSHTLFCGATDKPRAGELINVLREAGQPVPPELLKFGTAVKKKESKLYGAHFKDVDLSQKAKKMTFDSDDE